MMKNKYDDDTGNEVMPLILFVCFVLAIIGAILSN
jgi:hypothetical protein